MESISIEKDIVDLTRRRYDLIEHDRRRESESREREEKFAGVKKLLTCRDTPFARGDAIVTHGNVSVDVRKYRWKLRNNDFETDQQSRNESTKVIIFVRKKKINWSLNCGQFHRHSEEKSCSGKCNYPCATTTRKVRANFDKVSFIEEIKR